MLATSKAAGIDDLDVAADVATRQVGLPVRSKCANGSNVVPRWMAMFGLVGGPLIFASAPASRAAA